MNACTAAGLSFFNFETMLTYEDGITDRLVDAVAQALGRKRPEVLEDFGTYVVSEGRILVSGTAEEIVQHEQVKQKYLGEIEMPTRTERLSIAGTDVEDDEEEPVSSPVVFARPKRKSRRITSPFKSSDI